MKKIVQLRFGFLSVFIILALLLSAASASGVVLAQDDPTESVPTQEPYPAEVLDEGVLGYDYRGTLCLSFSRGVANLF